MANFAELKSSISLSRRKINKIIYFAFGIRFIGILIRSFGDIVQPHVWRQIDTLGISYRYWLRFAHEPLHMAFFLPAALQSGDGNGILPVEFPFLNFIFFPLWSAGPYWGKVFIYLLLATCIFGLCKKLSNSKTWMATAFLLLPFVSFSADYIEKFIPDTLATLLVGLGCIKLIRNRNLSALAFITLGLLMKPSAIVALAILLTFSTFRKSFWRYAVQLTIPIGICLLYYTLGVKFIDHYRTGEANFFYVQFRPPLQSLWSILSNPRFILNEFANRVFYVGGLFFVIVGVFLMPRRFRFPAVGLFALLVVQFLTIAALDGGHSAQHDYYYMGMSLVAASLLILIIRKSARWFATVLTFILLFHSIELTMQNLNPSKLKRFYQLTSTCSKLKVDHPELPWNQAYVFRSSVEPFPSLGLCFGEREGSLKNEYGIFYTGQPIPNECSEISRNEPFLIVRCAPH